MFGYLKVKSSVLLGFSLFLLAFLFISETQGQGILKEDKASNGIDKGYVIAYGEKIAPPFFVTYEDGKVLINGIVFSPRQQKQENLNSEITVPESITKKHEFIVSCRKYYTLNRDTQGDVRAKELLIEEYKDNSLVSELIWIGDDLQIVFADGLEMRMFLASSSDIDKSTSSRKTRIQELRFKEKEILISFLVDDWMVAFGDNYMLYIPTVEASEILDVVRKADSGVLTSAQAADKITTITRKREFAVEILGNSE